MTPELHLGTSQLGIALSFTQAGANGLLALVLFALHRVYRRPFLLHWSAAWLALACANVGAALGPSYVHLPDEHVLRLLLTALTLSAGYAHVTGLLSGTWLLLRTAEPGARTRRVPLLALPVVLGCAGTFGTLALAAPERVFARFPLLGCVTALAFLGACTGVARVARREPTLARALVAGLFGLSGLVEASEALAGLARLEGAFLDSLASLVVPRFLDLFVQLFLLSSLLLWFFEDERRALARTARALSESEQQRQRSEHMEAVGRLAGGLAHDFNNLLTAITGHAEILLARADEGHPDREDLLPIARAAGRAAELVRELLTFSRRQPVRPRHFSLDRLLADMRRVLERLVGESVRLELELGAPGAVLFADPALIELAVINLASNARDAIAGSGRVVLRTRITRDEGLGAPLGSGRCLSFEVSDDGCGIRADELGKIFEPFYTTKPGKGTGLGLASVYGIVKQSGGEIRVESVPGQGATFRIWLPLAAAELASQLEERELVPLAPPRGGSESILLVEDDHPVRQLAHRHLAKAGYRVVTAENPDQAMECLRASPGDFQLLLSDVVMPGRALREFLEELRLHHPELRILLMSGYSASAIGQRGIELARAHFLAKPFTAKALLDAVRSALDGPVTAELARRA